MRSTTTLLDSCSKENKGRKNIFAHFLNDDLLRFSGFNRFDTNSAIHALLSNLLVHALLLTKEHVLVPGGFVDSSSNYNLIKNWLPLFHAGLLRLPMRELSVDEYLGKKLKEWDGLSSTYDMLTEERIGDLATFLNEALVGRIYRPIEMGDSLAQNWESAPDESDIWKRELQRVGLNQNEIELLRTAARKVRDRGAAVLEGNLQSILTKSTHDLSKLSAKLLYHDYASIYASHFDSELLHSIPFFDHCELHTGLPFYDYRVIDRIFIAMAISHLLIKLNAKEILALRSTRAFEHFTDTLFQIANEHPTPQTFWFNISQAIDMSSQVRQLRRKSNVMTRDPVGLVESIVYDVLSNARIPQNNSNLRNVFVPRRYLMVKDRVFVVHGHDNEMKQTVARFLEKLGLDAIILHEKPSGGLTVVEKIERFSEVEYAVVLLSPDDVGGADVHSVQPRARQNVVFELGYFVGKLGRQNVVVLMKQNVEKPSDFDGVVYVKYGEDWRTELARELHHAGLNFNIDALIGVSL